MQLNGGGIHCSTTPLIAMRCEITLNDIEREQQRKFRTRRQPVNFRLVLSWSAKALTIRIPRPRDLFGSKYSGRPEPSSRTEIKMFPSPLRAMPTQILPLFPEGNRFGSVGDQLHNYEGH